MTLTINAAFDSGNIELRGQSRDEVRLAIRPDTASAFLQWFHFRLDGVRERAVQVIIENASETTYPNGWEDYDVATTDDLGSWYRTPASYIDGKLSWTAPAGAHSLWFAYFAPYSIERHDRLMARVAGEDGVELERLATTADGHSVDCLHLEGPHTGERDAGSRRQVWAIARQHPGESMAEWWMEGWLERLLDTEDATSRALRSMADIHVVPNMNPDGTARGHLRTNTCGSNLNREWAEPSIEKSPEVYHVRRRMHDTGVDLALDVHGDEALPYNFIAGTEGVPGWNQTRDAELIAFKHTLAALNPDFQTRRGYPRNRPGNANLAFASNYLAETFGCLAMTLEMPFKDTADTPRPAVGWSPERSARLGRSFVDAVYLALTDRLLPPPH
mgnify:CR=1 FL=1